MILFWLFNLQDAQIQELKEQLSSMSSQNEQMQATTTQQLSQIQQHKDQYNILKLKLGGFHPMLCNLMKKETSCSQEKDIVTDVKNDWAYFSVEIILLLFDVISMITFKDLLNCFEKRFQIYFCATEIL